MKKNYVIYTGVSGTVEVHSMLPLKHVTVHNGLFYDNTVCSSKLLSIRLLCVFGCYSIGSSFIHQSTEKNYPKDIIVFAMSLSRYSENTVHKLL